MENVNNQMTARNKKRLARKKKRLVFSREQLLQIAEEFDLRARAKAAEAYTKAYRLEYPFIDMLYRKVESNENTTRNA